MRVDMRVRYDADTRRAAAELFEKGYGYSSAATALSIPPGTVKQWCYTYAAAGLEGLLDMGSRSRRYSEGQKVAAASAVVDRGMTVADARDACELFGRMIRGEETDPAKLAELDEASCLESISRMPARVKCAELAWRTLDEMLATGADSASAADPCVCDCGDGE